MSARGRIERKGLCKRRNKRKEREEKGEEMVTIHGVIWCSSIYIFIPTHMYKLCFCTVLVHLL